MPFSASWMGGFCNPSRQVGEEWHKKRLVTNAFFILPSPRCKVVQSTVQVAFFQRSLFFRGGTSSPPSLPWMGMLVLLFGFAVSCWFLHGFTSVVVRSLSFFDVLPPVPSIGFEAYPCCWAEFVCRSPCVLVHSLGHAVVHGSFVSQRALRPSRACEASHSAVSGAGRCCASTDRG